MNALDRLIALHQEAYDETFSWEKRQRRYGWTNKVLLVFNVGLLANNSVMAVMAPSLYSIMLVLIAAGLLIFTLWLIQRHEDHTKWILDTRAEWEVGLRHWQAVKIELAETGAYPEWAIPPPNYS